MIVQPYEIEKRSFEIIGSELDPEFAAHPDLDLIKRVIHTTADFEYAGLLEISSGAAAAGLNAVKSGKKIYADTTMIVSGVNKRLLAKYGSGICTLVDDESVRSEAERTGVTRSIIGIEQAASRKEIGIFAIGNAPTALFKLCEMIDAGLVKPDLVIGVPVGFVGAAESKEELSLRKVPYILTRGRKGGSTVAVSIINAILYRSMGYDER